MIDGSGLAGNNYISPLALTQLLRYMRQHPRYAIWEFLITPRGRLACSGRQQYIRRPGLCQ